MEISIRQVSEGIFVGRKVEIPHNVVVDGDVVVEISCSEADGPVGCLRKALKALRAEEDAKPKKKRGPRKTTGRYATREELVWAVWDFWLNGPHKQSDIARIVRVSEGTVGKILDEPKPEGVDRDPPT